MASAVLRSQFASSQARALARKSSTEIIASVLVAVMPFLSESVDAADALAVPLGVAVEHAVGGEAPQVEVEVVLPGEPDAAVDLEALLRELRAGIAGVRLGDAHDLRRGGPSVGDRVGGGRRRSGAHLGPEADVGEDVLERLERTDRTPERDARLGIFDGDLGEPTHGADRLRDRERDG